MTAYTPEEIARPDLNALGDRVLAFQCMELPGQPMMMHMGTSYLVHDLWKAVNALNTILTEKDRPDAG